MKRKILITGSEGFIGSHLTETLVKSGYDVKALILYNFNNSLGWLEKIDKKYLDKIDIITGDIRDLGFLLKITKNVDTIINLAALISIPYSYNAPYSNIETNIMGTYNILEASKWNKLNKIIMTSTSEVYGTAQKVPINEDHPINPQSPYAASKSSSDKISMSYFKSYGLPVCILRPFNTFGPRQSLRAIIPSIMTQALSNKKVVKVGNLNPRRDFTYIDDTVRAFMLALKSKKVFGQEINIGNGFDLSIKDYIQILKKDLNLDFKIKIESKRLRPNKSEVFRLLASNQKAKRILKWKPMYSGLTGFKKGLFKTLEWYKDPENLENFNTNIYNI